MSDTPGEAAPSASAATSQKVPAEGGLSGRAKRRLVTAGLFLASIICFVLWVAFVQRDVSDQSHALRELVGGLGDSPAKRTVESARAKYDGDVFLSQLALVLAVLLSYGGAVMLAVGNVASKLDDSKRKKAEQKSAEKKSDAAGG